MTCEEKVPENLVAGSGGVESRSKEMWTQKRIDVGACEVGYDPSGRPAVSQSTKMKMPCGDENGSWRGLIGIRVEFENW